MVQLSDLILTIRRTLLSERHISNSWLSLPDDLASLEACRRRQTCCLVAFRSLLRFLPSLAVYLQVLHLLFLIQILLVACTRQACLTRTCCLFVNIVITVFLREVRIMTAFIEEIFLDLLAVELFQILVVVELLFIATALCCDDAVWVIVCV